MLASLLSAKVAAAATVAAVAVGGTAAAAFAGKLPSPAQKLAHDTIGAPMTPGPRATHTAGAHPKPSSLPGQAAFGLCTAWQHMETSGTAAQKATAFRRLEAAAGGASQVSSFCAGVQHPGNSGSKSRGNSSAGSSGHSQGKPATAPSHGAASHGSGSHAPAQHPSGQSNGAS